MFDPINLDRLRALVRVAAREELIDRFQHVHVRRKADGSIVTEADLAMQARLQRELSDLWPQFAFLGEEMTGAQQAAALTTTGQGLWCVDPLDGTSNFAAGIPFFAVSVALIVDGEVTAGVVFDPVRDECFSALRGQGAWLNGEALCLDPADQTLRESMAIVDLKRLPPALIHAVATASPFRSQRSFGSVVLDWCWIAAGRCQVYLHGGQKLWDYAAGQLIARESGAGGGVYVDFADRRFSSLTLEPRIAIAASHNELLEDWRAWIDEAR